MNMLGLRLCARLARGLLGLALLGNVAAAPVLQLVSTEYPPYCGSELPEQGVFTALTRAAFKAAGFETRVVFRPWARVLAEARAGQHDAVLAVWYQAEREQYMVYSDPLWVNRIGFYARAGETHPVHQLSALKGLRIGIVRGYANPPEFEAADLGGEAAVDDLTNLRKLQAGRLDLVLIEQALAAHLLKTQLREADGQLVWLEPALASPPLYVTLTRGKPQYRKHLAAFNRGLAEIRRNGEYARIVQRLLGPLAAP
ncbi:substrate-binding periplasmic protein [Chitinimonas taiwanensis]|uniref:substrate-binding periplasmic protein n=1 Tax=Chitinimonas taiwanensis TaxID=240412 RepID=UPI0035B27F8A